MSKINDMILSLFAEPMVAAMTGFGFFWLYALLQWDTMFSIVIGLYASALMSRAISLIKGDDEMTNKKRKPNEHNNEYTFMADCDICQRKNTPCRSHHLIPSRLLKKLPPRLKKRWEFQKVNACNSCNSFLHPENHLYKKIEFLESRIKELENR